MHPNDPHLLRDLIVAAECGTHVLIENVDTYTDTFNHENHEIYKNKKPRKQKVSARKKEQGHPSGDHLHDHVDQDPKVETVVIMSLGARVIMSFDDATCCKKFIACKEAETENTCFICADHPPNACIMPCGHGGLCYRCGQVLSTQERHQQCPICRGVINQLLKISKCEERKGQKVFIATEGLHRKKNGMLVPVNDTSSTARAVATGTATAAVTSVASPIDSAESLLAQLNLFPAGASVLPLNDIQFMLHQMDHHPL